MKQESHTAVPLGDVAGEVGDVVHGGAEAGRADHRAVGAGQAPGRDIVPAGTLDARVQQLLEPVGVQGAAHPAGSGDRDVIRRGEIVDGCRGR